jgi:hypothetical protein
MRYTTSSFIAASRIKHKTFYTYNNTLYINSKSPISITCPSHGEFIQRPDHHLSGSGCKVCGADLAAKARSKDPKDVIASFIETHGGIYNYRHVPTDYVNSKSLVRIVCSTHGVFRQCASNHGSGKGCPICARSKAHGVGGLSLKTAESKKEYFNLKDSQVYLFKSNIPLVYKIGISGNIDQRLSDLNKSSTLGFSLVGSLKCTLYEACHHETFLHNNLSRYLHTHRFYGYTELFLLSKKDLKGISNYLGLRSSL